MRAIFTHRFTVPGGAIDMNGHVNNIEYLRWMQDVATQHSAACGWTISRYVENLCSWVVRSHQIEYLRPAFAGEELTLLTWIAGFAEQTSPRGYLVWRASDQRVLARAQTLWVFVDGRSGRPAAIPADFRASFDTVDDEEAVLRFARSLPLVAPEAAEPSQAGSS